MAESKNKKSRLLVKASPQTRKDFFELCHIYQIMPSEILTTVMNAVYEDPKILTKFGMELMTKKEIAAHKKEKERKVPADRDYQPYCLHFNVDSEGDLIAQIDAQPRKKDYIVRLIREDMERRSSNG